jgi:hypothetical protein
MARPAVKRAVARRATRPVRRKACATAVSKAAKKKK